MRYREAVVAARAPCGAQGDQVKVLHVISSVDPRAGGPVEGVFSSSEVWFHHGHQRHIVSLDPPRAPWVATARAPTRGVGPDSALYRLARAWIPWLRYGYAPRLVDWLRQNAPQYDAVIVNGLWNYASLGAWRALHGSATPYFVFTHGMLDPWFNQAYPTKTFFKRIFWWLFERRVLRDAAGVLFTCEEERRLAGQSFRPYQAREFVVGYGTRDVSGDPETQRTAFFARAPDARGRRLILFLSRIHEKKGVDLLVAAFAPLASANPEVDLVIAGPDQSGLRRTLTATAKRLGIADRIHWPGMLSGDAKWGAFRTAEFFVLPSHQENFGIVVAEAMALGKPLLITDKVNIWREVQADGAGIVVKDDLEGVSDGLARALALTATERYHMGAAARRSFESRYDLEKNALSLLELISTIVPAKAQPSRSRSARA